MDDLIEDNICELICMAHGERFENVPDSDRKTIKTYASSILTYVRNSIGE